MTFHDSPTDAISELSFLCDRVGIDPSARDVLLQDKLTTPDAIYYVFVDDDARFSFAESYEIPEFQLYLLAICANLRRFRGPGQFIANAMVAELDWADFDDDQEVRNELAPLLSQHREDILRFFEASVIKPSITTQEKIGRKQNKWLNTLMLLLVFVLFAIELQPLWHRLFPPTTNSLQVVLKQSLDTQSMRTFLLVEAVWAAIVLGLILFVFQSIYPRMAERVTFQIQKRLGKRRRDAVTMADAYFTYSSRGRWLWEILYRYFPFLMVIPMPVFLFVVYRGIEFDRYEAWSPILVFAGLAILQVVLVWFSVRGFMRLNTTWSSQALTIYAGQTLAPFLINAVLGILVFMAALGITQISINMGAAWAEQRIVRQLSDFQQSVQALDMSTREEQELSDWGARYADFHLSGWKQNKIATDRLLESIFIAFRATVFALLLSTGFLLFFAINRVRGFLVIVGSLLFGIAVDIAPGMIEQWVTGQRITINLTFIGLALLLFLAVVTQIVSAAASYRDTKECPECFRLSHFDYCPWDRSQLDQSY